MAVDKVLARLTDLESSIEEIKHDIEVLKDLPGNDRTVVGIRRKSYV